MYKLFSRLRRNFIVGIGMILPLIITYLFVRWIFNRIHILLIQPVLIRLEPYVSTFYLKFITAVAILFLSFILITLIGILARFFLFRKMLTALESFLIKLPLLGKIYKSVKQISNSFLGAGRGIFKKVVLVEYPHPEKFCIGFITAEGFKELQEKSGHELLAVFIPTTPNPTSGMLIYFPKEKIKILNISVEEGLKLIISGGVVTGEK